MKIPSRPLAVAVILLLRSHVWAGSVFGLTTDNRLLVFDADVPQNVSSIQPITGLEDGENVLGIDVRPATGQLYAVTSISRLLVIEPNTGAAASQGTISTALTGANFGVDFNPVVDRLRVLSSNGQNLRINPDTAAAIVDGTLAYAVGDVNVGATPNVVDAAYANNAANAATTTLYALDEDARVLATVNPPNAGTLNTVGPFGKDPVIHAGFDIAPDGTALVAAQLPGPNTVLVSVDLATGADSSRGPIGDGTIALRDIAAAQTISFSQPRFAISEAGGSATISVTREGFTEATTAVVQYNTFSETASAGSDYATASGVLAFGVNEGTKTFQVPVINDVFPEGDETVGLLLTPLSGPAVIGTPVATLRINANDTTDTSGPLVEFIGLTGPSRGIDGAVVHFNEDLDPVTAVNLDNYSFTLIPRTGGKQKMSFSTAVYDPVERTVTLGLTPFAQTEFKKTAIRINGKAGGVTDLAGNLLDGDANGKAGGNAMQLFKVFSGTTVNFKDRDGDKATLTIANGGQLDGVRPVGASATQFPQFWILNSTPIVSTLSGSVVAGRRGNGIIVVAEIIGLDKKEFTPLLSNPSFQVNTLTFSSNATGAR